MRDGERRLPVPGVVRELHVSRRAVVAGGWAEHQADGAQQAHGHDDAANEECATTTLMNQFGRVDFQAAGQACKSIELIDKQWQQLASNRLTWKLLGHHQNTAEGEHHSASRQANDDCGAARYNYDLAQHHKYPNDKHTQHVGADGRNQLATNN